MFVHIMIGIIYVYFKLQLAGAIEYTNCIFVEW